MPGPLGGIVRQRIRERVQENFPLATAIANGVQAAADRHETAIQPADVPAVVREVQDAIAEHPVAAAVVSAEPWYKNRVKVGLVIAGAGLVFNRLGWDLGLSDADKELITTIVIAFGGGVAALGEWLAKWLAGIRWSRPWTIIGIGR